MNKEQIKKIKLPDGFRYSGEWNGLYHFIKEIRKADGSYAGYFLTISANEEDLLNGNLDFMLDKQLTRVV